MSNSTNDNTNFATEETFVLLLLYTVSLALVYRIKSCDSKITIN